MDRNLWADFVNYPSWPCPRCQSGHYRLIPNSMLKVMSRQERLDRTKPGSQNESLERFTAHLRCDSPSCAETATIAGDYYEAWYSDGTEEGFTDRSYRPWYITPAPLPFKIDKKVPGPVEQLVRQAASLFWSDPKAAAGRIREVIDAILTTLGIDLLSDKGKPLNLHKRIEQFRLIEGGKWALQADMVEAAKWIGNEGAHEAVEREDVLDAFEMLEAVIEDIFVSTRGELLEKVRKTNAKHRKVSPKPPAISTGPRQTDLF